MSRRLTWSERAALCECREERMRAGLDHHVVSMDEVRQRARGIESLEWWRQNQAERSAKSEAFALRCGAVGR